MTTPIFIGGVGIEGRESVYRMILGVPLGVLKNQNSTRLPYQQGCKVNSLSPSRTRLSDSAR